MIDPIKRNKGEYSGMDETIRSDTARVIEKINPLSMLHLHPLRKQSRFSAKFFENSPDSISRRVFSRNFRTELIFPRDSRKSGRRYAETRALTRACGKRRREKKRAQREGLQGPRGFAIPFDSRITRREKKENWKQK